MKLNKLTIIGFLSLLSVIKSIGQDSLVDITSKSNNGYCDVILNIVEKQLINEFWIITAKGHYKGTVVGISVKLKDGLRPGLVNGEMDNTTWARGAVEISTIGEESDNFVKILSGLYGIKTDKPFTAKPIVFTCFSLNSEKAILDQGYFQFKIYFDDTNKSGVYTEIFLNTNFPEGYIEIPDRDPQHREGFIKAMIR